MKFLFKIIKPHIKQVILLMLLYAIGSVCSLFMPYIMSDIVDVGIRNQNLDYIWKEGAIMVALAVGAFATALVTNYVVSKFASEVGVETRQSIFNKVNSLTFEHFSEIGTGGLITRTTEDVSWMESIVSQAPYVLVTAPTMFIGGIILSFKGDWVLPLIFLGISLLAVGVAVLITLRTVKYWQRGDEFTDEQNRVVRERLSGIRVVRAFNKENYEHRRAVRATSAMNNSFVKANTVNGLVSPVVSLFLNVATVAVIYVGAVRLQTSPSLKAGDILATIQYIVFILNAILVISWTIASIPQVKVSLGRVQQIVNLESSRDEESTDEKLAGEVQFSNVSFAYGNAQTNALHGINFRAKEGETVGIIGGTGSGKTTLIKLLLGFYPPTEGQIVIGGRNSEEISSATIRNNVSVCMQKCMIFEGTVAENVKMGNASATDEEVREALQIAQMANFVEEKEEGINYNLTPSGNNISGGQKQRITIARTLLKPASVYVFDDSFSALDYLTESNLRKALNRRLQGKTQIIITQRAATAMRCDRVYVLEDGNVVGEGTHKQLMKTCQTYREIYQSQIGGDGNE